MGSLDTLPPDQRAVLQLVLQRGRSYDDIAAMLSIDRAAVRQRALDAFDALGPTSSIPDGQRALLTDYLLGQLPPRVAEQVRERLAGAPPERAWLRVIASEIGSVATAALPEIPVSARRRAPEDAAPATEAAAPPARQREPAAAAAAAGEMASRRRERSARQRDRAEGGEREGGRGGETPPRAAIAPPSSRRGGALLLGGAVLIVVAIVVVVLATSGGGNHRVSGTVSRPQTTAGTASTPTTSTTGTTPNAKPLHQINLKPSAAGSKAAGIAEVVQVGNAIGIVLEAQNMPPTSGHTAYAVWLSNPGGASKLVGYVDQTVGKDGKLATEGALPSDATKYSQMLVTLETHSSPKTPGQVILQGPFAE